jgi:hypothetical protein
MDGPPTDYQEVPKKEYTAHLQLLPPREGIPSSASSPNLVQGTYQRTGMKVVPQVHNPQDLNELALFHDRLRHRQHQICMLI